MKCSHCIEMLQFFGQVVNARLAGENSKTLSLLMMFFCMSSGHSTVLIIYMYHRLVDDNIYSAISNTVYQVYKISSRVMILFKFLSTHIIT